LMNWLRNNKIEVAILTTLSIFINLVNYINTKGMCISFFDPDDYMRLVHEFEWLSGENFYNNIIERANSPFGGSMHWSRLYDLLWLIPVRLVSLFTQSIKSSIEIIGFVISPIIQLVSITILFRIFQFVLSKKDAFIAIALFVAHPFIVSQTIFGRPDHHSFLICMMIVYMYYISRLVRENFEKKETCIIVAIVSACCIWASPETLIPLLLSDVILFFVSFKNFAVIKTLYFKSLLIACITGMLVYLSGNITNYPLILAVVFLILPYAIYNAGYDKSTILKNWHIIALAVTTLIVPLLQPVEYDKLSVVHMGMYIYASIFFCINMLYSKREMKDKLFYISAWTFVILVAFFMCYPKFLLGMGADISPYVKNIWLNKVEEMKSPFSSDEYFGVLIFVLISLAALYYKVKDLITQKSLSANNIIWMFFSLIGGIYIILGCFSIRMMPYAVLFMCPVVIDCVMNCKIFKVFPRYAKLLLAVILMLGSQFLSITSHAKSTNIKPAYTNAEFYNMLNLLSKKPTTILASINIGSEILWKTKHKIVASPYHRHEHGIIAEYEILQNEFNSSTVKQYLNSTDTTYIVINKNRYPENAHKRSLGYYLAHYADNKGWTKSIDELRINIPNEILDWISIVSIDKKFNDIVVAKVIKKN